MAKPVLGKSLCSYWFFLCQDFALRAVSMEMGQPVFFCFGAKQRKNKKKCEYCHSSQRNYQKKLKRLIFSGNFKDHEDDKHSPSEFYYPEDLETFDAETETGITESQEATDDFINQQKSANTNKKTATDMNTLIRYLEANGMKNEKIESLPAFERDHLLLKFFWNARKKNGEE